MIIDEVVTATIRQAFRVLLDGGDGWTRCVDAAFSKFDICDSGVAFENILSAGSGVSSMTYRKSSLEDQ